ncbi:MAG: hypothetical protein SV186_01105 [Candidatus Nanohaloarchaea archaeon]|nr:hypothetical protein [Candidatus Nanohaloarchaea archaeon]
MELQSDTEDGRTILQSEDKQHTVMNLVRSTLWDAGAAAGYDKGHPYVGSSKLVFDTNSPADDVAEAVEKAKEDLNDFREAIPE